MSKLFQDDAIDRIYESPPFKEPVFDEFAFQFVSLVNAAITAGKRVIRVLEVGARLGHLTKLLGQALVDSNLAPGHYVEYVCSDTDILLAQKAMARSPWTTMTSVTFDPTVSIGEQTLEPASFDIVVAFDSLHSCSDIRTVVTNLRKMLVVGGYLSVIELDGDSFSRSTIGTKWMEFVFGSFCEWTAVRQEDEESINYPVSLQYWKTALQLAGYDEPLALVSAASGHLAHLAFISQAFTPTRLTNGISKAKPNLQCDDWTVFRYFAAGDEPDLVAFVSGMSASKPYSLWLHSDTTSRNAALVGLSRSLGHEFPSWKIFAVLFHSSWDQNRQRAYILEKLIPLNMAHAELLIDESGSIFVPRVVEAPEPQVVQARGPHAVRFSETQIWRDYPAELFPEDVEVDVSFVSVSSIFPGHSEFSGTVTAIGEGLEGESQLVGQRVFGIVSGHSGSIIVCPRSRVSVIPDDLPLSSAAALVGRLVFVSLVIMKALPSNGNRHIILHAGEFSAAAWTAYSYLKSTGFEVLVTMTKTLIPDMTSDFPDLGLVYDSGDCRSWTQAVHKCAPNGVGLAISFDPDQGVGAETIQIMAKNSTLVQVEGDLPDRLPRGQRYISVDWNNLAEEDFLFQGLADIPPVVRDAFFSSVEVFNLNQLSLAHERTHREFSGNIAVVLGLEDIDTELPVMKGGAIAGTAAFNSRASYVLIGGVGGLGINIAKFLVENGARHLVLTSRSGSKALKHESFTREKRMIEYLRGRPGVTVDIFSVECLDVQKTKELFASIERPVAGVFFLPVRLNDQLFVNLKSDDDWHSVYDVKVKGLQVLLEAVDPASLDFLVLTSTLSALSGSPGQTNYTAAQVQMEKIGATLPNTISVAVPPVLDAGILARSMGSAGTRRAALEKYKSFGVVTRQVVQQCFDAILSLGTQPRNSVYIPTMDWKMTLQSGLAPTRSQSIIRHLVTKDVDGATLSGTSDEGTIRAACAKVLSLAVDEIEETVPLSGYGLDSLTAARLRGILKSSFGLDVTQLQLLSGYMTGKLYNRLVSMQVEQAAEAVAEETSAADTQDPSLTDNGYSENDMNQTIVRLNSVKDGSPVFIVHGAGGGVLVLRKIAQQVQVPVYGVQDTPEAPLTGTLQRLATFYLEKIKQKQFTGPYRLGGFSFGAAVALAIAQQLRAAGETVEMLIMLDGAPTLYHRPEMREHIREIIIDGSMDDSIMEVVKDMVASGVLDDAEDIQVQFEEHFKDGGQKKKWVARFRQAYTAHLLMGVRESMEMERREKDGILDGLVWPAQQTVLMKAERGTKIHTRAQGASEAFDLDKWTDKVEVYECPGTHFGMLNPVSGASEILNATLQRAAECWRRVELATT
ncbi:uncharacterized protein FIBRA_02484 [Fibroporia radiculosa]|uniref:Carrier domain-containing protein n=1 Tax=Fibroporia radiculosa TaxID=599839 RepID=J4HV09_9APHY|nr:uncharacterized protein FIBRA_02484 [Fibroporia radiculosa]CCM00452.1 predicted protein [Fibroporia radiculosa]